MRRPSLIMLLGLLTLAMPAVAEEIARGTIIDGLKCASDPTQTYAVYLPAAYVPGQHRPLLFVFDPRRRGAFAAELFQAAAERYGWIVASSNDTLSDESWAPNETAVRAMLPDVLRRFDPDRRRIYATGFSGGAMVAWWLAQRTNAIAGVIGCSGRLADPKDAENVRFDWFGTAGNLDFNYGETRTIDAKLAANAAANATRNASAYRYEIFEGTHRWAPRELLADAVGWMELQAMRRGTRARDEALIQTLFGEDSAAAKRLESRPLEQLRRYEAIARTFDGIAPLESIRATIAALSASPAVARARKEEKHDDEFEASYRIRIPVAINAFLHADDPRPATLLSHDLDVTRLQVLAKQKTSLGVTAQRVLETLAAQVSFYLPRDLIARKNYGMAAAVLSVACEIHPGRADLEYDLACANAQAKRKRDALEALDRAVSHGFHDAVHATSDPDLLSLHGDRRFEEIVGRMKL